VKYLATIAGQTFAVDVRPGGQPGRWLVSVDGREHEVDLETTARGWLHSLLLDGRSYQVARSADEVEVEGRALAVDIERDLGLARAAGAGAAAGPARLKAPIPGLVVAVNVAVGDEVQQGQALLIVEAMKMQMELKSPRSGHIKELTVQPGQEVTQGQRLATIGE